MIERQPININACNFEQFRAVAATTDANLAALFDEVAKLRSDFDALIDRLAVRPT
jgi:hypothetical protein